MTSRGNLRVKRNMHSGHFCQCKEVHRSSWPAEELDWMAKGIAFLAGRNVASLVWVWKNVELKILHFVIQPFEKVKTPSCWKCFLYFSFLCNWKDDKNANFTLVPSWYETPLNIERLQITKAARNFSKSASQSSFWHSKIGKCFDQQEPEKSIL